MLRCKSKPAIEVEKQLHEELIWAAIQSGQGPSDIVRRTTESEIYWLDQYQIKPISPNYEVLSNATLR
jgi:hypothetical protein